MRLALEQLRKEDAELTRAALAQLFKEDPNTTSETLARFCKDKEATHAALVELFKEVTQDVNNTIETLARFLRDTAATRASLGKTFQEVRVQEVPDGKASEKGAQLCNADAQGTRAALSHIRKLKQKGPSDINPFGRSIVVTHADGSVDVLGYLAVHYFGRFISHTNAPRRVDTVHYLNAAGKPVILSLL